MAILSKTERMRKESNEVEQIYWLEILKINKKSLIVQSLNEEIPL
jgi:hypothetical protein